MGFDYIFPYHLFHRNDRIIICASVEDIEKIRYQLIAQEYVEILCFIDKEGNNAELLSREYDAILLLEEDCEIAEKIKRNMISMGIDHTKIFLWERLLRVNDFLRNIYLPMLDNADFLIGKRHELNNVPIFNQIIPLHLDFTDFSLRKVKYGMNQLVVDVAIPIYNAYDYTKACIYSVLKNTSIPYNLYLLNDCSTDSRVHELLTEIQKSYSSSTLRHLFVMEHKDNKGFLESVNEIMRITKNHLVLLNSDTEVPGNWLQRLISPILKDESVASVTPITNAASICSFPLFGRDNELPKGASLDEVDRSFSVISERHVIDIPVGVGFCLAMNRMAIRDVGFFDTIFGKGYGEESDWCMRASCHGWKHVWCTNLFVYHKHGASFGNYTKKERNSKILIEKYPDYSSKTSIFIKEKKWRLLYNWSNFLLSIWRTQKYMFAYFNVAPDLSKSNNWILIEWRNDKIMQWSAFSNRKLYEFCFTEADINMNFFSKIFEMLHVRWLISSSLKLRVPEDMEQIYQLLKVREEG